MRNKKLIVILIVVCSLTLLIVLNSVIFSVQHVNAYCYNADDEELEQTVIANSGIKKGSSIFTLKKDDVISSLNNSVYNIKVINVEKKFPNVVYINYARIYEYFQIAQDGKYYFCSNDGKIMRISDSPGLSSEIIALKLANPITNTQQGEKFASQSSEDMILTVELLSALERLQYHHEVVEMIDFIDISKSQYIFIKMASGVYMELQGSSNILPKMVTAFSVYAQESTIKTTGTIIVPDGDGKECSWSPKDRYGEIMNKL